VQETAALPARRPTGRFWPWLAAGLLAATVAKYAIVLAVIAGDPSIAIEEDYYERAVAWDDERAARSASAALGWSARIEIVAAPGLPGRAEARIELLDVAGIFHQARAAEAIEVTSTSSAEGFHRLAIPGARTGAWRVEIEATRDGERFIEERTVLFGAASAERRGPR
jgi:nitrogen fixation protein FixH